MRDLTIREAERLLTELRPASRETRDDTIRTAYASGVSKTRIAELAGVARSTVYRALRSQPDIQEP